MLVDTPAVSTRLWHHCWRVGVSWLYALSTAFGLGALLIWGSGGSVVAAYTGLVVGMCGSWAAGLETIVTAMPYLLTGLAVAVGFHGGLFNIGAEGQFYLGALSAAVVGTMVSDVPGWLHLPLALMASILGGALWGALPGFLKARFGAHEVINTIMMNYIAVKLVDYLVKQVFRDPGASLDRTPYVLESARLPLLFGDASRLHAGFFVAGIAAVSVAGLLFCTTWGFAIRTVGRNAEAARYAGIPVTWTTVLTMALAGSLAGLAGAGEVLGLHHTLPAAFSTGYGFEGIAVALLARSSPLGLVPVALLWGGLRNGAGLMQLRAGVSIDVISIVQALVVLCIAADDMLRWLYRFVSLQFPKGGRRT